VVAPQDWWGRCEGNFNSQTQIYTQNMPREYSSSIVPFTDYYCVAEDVTTNTGEYYYNHFSEELYVANDRGGLFTIEGE
jgi:hypothetical protein